MNPIKFTIDGRVYEFVPFLKEGEELISGKEMAERAKQLGAELGEEDAKIFLEHQDEIPGECQDFNLIFFSWNDRDHPTGIAYLCYDTFCWYQYWEWVSGSWGENDRLVRRVA